MSLSEEVNNQHARLAVLKASEIELTEGATAALKVLGPPTDPVRMRAALGILVRAGQHQEAARLIQGRHPDEAWIDLAALLLAFLGEVAQAQAMVQRADQSSDLLVMRRSRLAFAEGCIDRVRQNHPEQPLLGFRDWAESDRDIAMVAVDALEPLLSLVRANRRVQGDLELAALTYAAYCFVVLGDRQQLKDVAGWLLKYVPMPLITAELCLRRLIDCPNNLATRLRAEHPGDFQASFLAAYVDRELLARSDEAFEAFASLAGIAGTREEKESLCAALFESVSVDNVQRVIDIVRRLQPHNQRVLPLLSVISRVAHGELAKAKEELEAVRDDSDAVWWQVHAQLMEKAGDAAAAQSSWEQAAQLLPHTEVLRRSVQASLDRRRFEVAVRELKKLLATSPDSVRELRILTWTYIQLQDYVSAADTLKRLVTLEPSVPEHRIPLAQCFARTNRPKEGIEALKPLCDSDDPPLDAMILQSELLSADGDVAGSLRLLERIAADNWDDPRFLLVYMKRAHAAGNDRLGYEALARLIELRQEGKVPSELMQEGTLERLLEHGKQFQQRREMLQEGVVQGRMAWLFADDLLGNPPSWAWALHTQPLSWLSEEPLSRAAYSVYATNGFTVRRKDGQGRLEAIEAPPRGTEVVVDLTSLLTLHHLGRLEQAADFYGKLILPSSYGELRIRDADRFGQHQPSREAELRTIAKEIDREKIRVVGGAGVGIPRVDEYSDEDYSYRMQDLVPPLQQAQKVHPQVIAELRRVAHKPGGANGNHPALTLGATVLIDLATLRTLANQAIFGAIVTNYQVCITSNERAEMDKEILAHESAREAKQGHDALWGVVERLAAMKKIEWASIRNEVEDAESDEGPGSAHLDALLLARQTRKPMLADDRVLQVLLYLERSHSNNQAFSSDHFLSTLLEQPDCNASSVAESFRNLIRWRYRFIVAPAPVLFTWALESKESLPGDALLDVATYVHDCLADPGLHCGLEDSEPPMPMAMKFLLAWTDPIAALLASVWSAKQFSDAAAGQLTRWVGEELVPSLPRGLWLSSVGINLAAINESMLSMAMVKLALMDDQHRARLGLREFASALAIEKSNLLETSAKVIHGFAT